jgi:hypothetical protein
VDGNNAEIMYCKTTDSLIVLATRTIERHEAIGTSFGEKYWFSNESDLCTLERAKVAYAAQGASKWIALTYHKRKQLKFMLVGENSDKEDNSAPITDKEPWDKDPFTIRQERGEGTSENTSQPRSVAFQDHLYSDDILDNPGVQIISTSHHESLSLNIDEHAHRTGGNYKDKQGLAKTLLIFCRKKRLNY